MFVLLLVGALLGAVIGFLYAQRREAERIATLAAQAASAQERARAAAERADLIDGHLAERFQALSAQALDLSQQRLLELTEGRFSAASQRAAGELESRRAAIEQLVTPLRDTLTRLETQLRDAESSRQRSHSAISEQVRFAMETSDKLRAQTQALVSALRRPEARGRWGEMQLRRVVELAGMSARVDFDEQVSVATAEGTLRPDMVIRLAGQKNVVVDAKVTLAAYLEAAEATDDGLREQRLGAHARQLRAHVDALAAKAYWAALSPAPEFVVLFIPGEAFLAPALERDPGLLEHAMSRRVHIATPTTLVSLLRTAQYAWQQEALSRNARQVFDLGKELYERLSGLGRNMDAVGRALTSAVAAYNRSVGSIESRVLVSARKLNSLDLTDADLEAPQPVESAVRPLSAPELVADLIPQVPGVSGIPDVPELAIQAEPAGGNVRAIGTAGAAGAVGVAGTAGTAGTTGAAGAAGAAGR